MKRNKKMSKKMSVMATNTMRFGAIILSFFVMVILNLLSSSSCTQLQNQKGAMEREIVKLDDALLRESTRWEGMMTPEKIDVALLRHGLTMSTPRADRVVRMMANGLPRPGQLSVAKAKARTEAMVGKTSDSVRKPARATYRRVSRR